MKTSGKYHVHAGKHVLPCVLSSRLLQQLASAEAEGQSRRSVKQNARVLKHVDPLAVGDEVRFVETGNGTGQILEILPRRNKLARPATGPGLDRFEQIIAANLDLVVPIFSTASPVPKWGLLDRYLVSAEAAGLPSLVCITKVDLVRPAGEDQAILDGYREIGYPVLYASPVSGQGLDELKTALQGRFSVLVGKSGVGKTSLINTLQPGLDLRVGEVTRGEKGKGRHTTTHLEMFNLDFGGAVMDTPGIREFGLWDLHAAELAWCFPEMRPYEGLCRFGLGCRHDGEPGCAIRAAVMAGAINPWRYKSYLGLREELP